MMLAAAGLEGAAAIALAAWLDHAGGLAAAETERLETALRYAQIHAAVALAIALSARRALVISGWAMILGSLTFAGALFSSVFWPESPLRAAAPVGGAVMILAWIGVFVAGVIGEAAESRARDERPDA